jgi:hypothetical protein
MNQKIMLSVRFEVPLLNILRLGLQRKPAEEETQADGARVPSVQPHIAVNDERRKLFQDALNCLGNLVHANPMGQKRVLHFVPTIMNLVGIKELNAVGCVRAIMEGNLDLCTNISEALLLEIVGANVKYGRRARWLDLLEIFLQCKGQPISR